MSIKTTKNSDDVNGILVFDKPAGCTSNQILQTVKRLYNARKAGHTGSLDPISTGLLPICFGKATKVSQYLLNSDKKYLVTAKLGQKTSTGDIEGDVVQTRTVKPISDSELEVAIGQFKGQIKQIPPMFSALKHNGKRLYELARQGIKVERTSREIQIYDFAVLKRVSDDLIKFSVHCSKGTYIRSLIEDLGDALGCGAHVVELRRIAAGPFTEEQMITLDALLELQEKGGCEALHNILHSASILNDQNSNINCINSSAPAVLKKSEVQECALG